MMWFTGKKNYYNLAVEKDCDFIFTSVTTIWKPGLSLVHTSNFVGDFVFLTDVNE